MTDLRDYEIVLGKLLGSLLPISLLLLGSVPVLSILLLLGGIDPEQVLQAVLILTATALGSGSSHPFAFHTARSRSASSIASHAGRSLYR